MHHNVCYHFLMNLTLRAMAHQDFTIQPLSDQQAPQYKALRLQALRLHPDAFLENPEAFEMKSIETITSLMQSARDKGGFTLVAINADGELVGTASLSVGDSEKLTHRGLIWGVYVAPEARRGGVARQLMESIITRATQSPQMRSLHLGVVCSNTRAFTLYESLGFSVYGTDKEALYVNGEYLDEYLMSKKLR